MDIIIIMEMKGILVFHYIAYAYAYGYMYVCRYSAGGFILYML